MCSPCWPVSPLPRRSRRRRFAASSPVWILDKKQLVLEGRGLGLRGTVLVFALAPDVQVMCGDQPAAPVDVAVGRRVRVEFEANGDRQIALTIQGLGGPCLVVAPPAMPAWPPNGDALSGVLRHVGYSDREVVLVGPGEGAGDGNDSGRARDNQDREKRQRGDPGRPQGGRRGDGAGREEGRPGVGAGDPGGAGVRSRRRRSRRPG